MERVWLINIFCWSTSIHPLKSRKQKKNLSFSQVSNFKNSLTQHNNHNQKKKRKKKSDLFFLKVSPFVSFRILPFSKKSFSPQPFSVPQNSSVLSGNKNKILKSIASSRFAFLTSLHGLHELLSLLPRNPPWISNPELIRTPSRYRFKDRILFKKTKPFDLIWFCRRNHGERCWH